MTGLDLARAARLVRTYRERGLGIEQMISAYLDGDAPAEADATESCEPSVVERGVERIESA